jgi:hypothetical protein
VKIKTIVYDQPDDFDALVNEALAEGYMLEYRGTLPGGTMARIGHYARLVLLDPEPEAEKADPMEAVRAVRATCLGTNVADCHTGLCPLAKWCEQLGDGGDPTDWVLPGEEGGM